MRLSVRFIAVAVICLSAMALPCLAQQPAASANPADHDNQFCTIAGTILSANTGEPLKKAQITIYKDEGDNEPHPQTASSDASGHFSIDHLAAGRYELRVSRVGYLDTQYGQDKPDKPGAVLTLIAGQKMTDLLFRMQRTAVIAGRITDEDSEPAREVPVEAFSRTIVRGKPKIERVGAANTNDLGEYRHYKALAWEKVSEDSYRDPDFLKPFESSAESVGLSENDRKSVQLKLIPAADSAN